MYHGKPTYAVSWEFVQDWVIGAGAVFGALAAIYAGWTQMLYPWLKPKFEWIRTAAQIRSLLDVASIERDAIKEEIAGLQRALERTNRRWEAARGAVGDLFFETDERGKIIFATPGFFAAIGIDKEHSLGDGWLSSVTQTDRECVAREWTFAHRYGRPFIMDFMLDGPNDDMEPARWSAKALPIVVGNKFAGLVGKMTKA